MCSGRRSSATAKINEVWCPPQGKAAILAARAAAHGTVSSASPTKPAIGVATASSPPQDQRVPARRGCSVSAPNASANEVGSGALGCLAAALVVLRAKKAPRDQRWLGAGFDKADCFAHLKRP
jgi:hypothetical protein